MSQNNRSYRPYFFTPYSLVNIQIMILKFKILLELFPIEILSKLLNEFFHFYNDKKTTRTKVLVLEHFEYF